MTPHKPKNHLVHNCHGLPIMLNMITRKHRRCYKHHVFASCQYYPHDPSCTCLVPYTGCKCNWVDCFNHVGEPDEPWQTVLQQVAVKCHQLVRCDQCSVIVFNEPEYGGLCGSCFVQKMVNCVKRGVHDDVCPICLDVAYKDDTLVLPCNHIIHCRCCQRMLDNRCPQCRADFDEQLVQDHFPPSFVLED